MSIGYTLYGSIHISFLKRQNDSDREQISDSQGQELGQKMAIKDNTKEFGE